MQFTCYKCDAKTKKPEGKLKKAGGSQASRQSSSAEAEFLADLSVGSIDISILGCEWPDGKDSVRHHDSLCQGDHICGQLLYDVVEVLL